MKYATDPQNADADITDCYNYEREQDAPEPEQPYPPCELCGEEGMGQDAETQKVFCSSECARCYPCEHRTGMVCRWRMDRGLRAGPGWIKRIKRCPMEEAKCIN